MHDGPYAETKEFLAGFGIIDVPDLDAALEWAARHPAAGFAQSRCVPCWDRISSVGTPKRSQMSEAATSVAIESVVRDSYGRLVAYLAARSGDVAGAEDALGDAFVAALKRWPAEGVPEKPEAWLLHVARNRMIDAARRNQVRQKSEEVPSTNRRGGAGRREKRTNIFLMNDSNFFSFARIQRSIRPPARRLMLQTVLGIDAARIASAFLVSPAAMSQRLVRAKNKIRDAAIPFRVPEPPELSERVSFVLDAIYAAYTTGWESLMETASTHHALAGEAILLGRMLAN